MRVVARRRRWHSRLRKECQVPGKKKCEYGNTEKDKFSTALARDASSREAYDELRQRYRSPRAHALLVESVIFFRVERDLRHVRMDLL